jgi:hypothetical protein
MFRRASVAVAVLVSLAGCAWSERAQIAAYFESAQSLAERMAGVGGEFEALMDAQEDPLAWSDEEKASLDAQYGALKGLGDEAASMSVPRAFSGAHPLLVQSIGEMAGAVDIIRGIAADPETATMEKADEMSLKAESGEVLANRYVSEIERILDEKYPELMAEGDGE